MLPLLRTLSQRPSTKFYTSAKFNISFTSNIYYWFFHECEPLNTPSNHVVIYFRYLLQICVKMNDFRFDFSKNFWREAPSPSPDPFPRFFSGFALGSGFAFNFRLGLRLRFSGASRPRFGLHPQLSIFRTWFDPQNKFLDLPMLVRAPFGKFLDLLLIINYNDWSVRCLDT